MNLKDSGRQYPLVAHVPFTYADLTDGIQVDAVEMPGNAIVTGGALVIETAFNSGTSDTLKVGDSADDDRYTASAVNAQSAGRTALTLTAYTYTGKDTIKLLWDGVGAVPTQGSGYLYLEYIMPGRANEAQPG